MVHGFLICYFCYDPWTIDHGLFSLPYLLPWSMDYRPWTSLTSLSSAMVHGLSTMDFPHFLIFCYGPWTIDHGLSSLPYLLLWSMDYRPWTSLTSLSSAMVHGLSTMDFSHFPIFCYGPWTIDHGLPSLPLTFKKTPYQLGTFVLVNAAGNNGFWMGYFLI
jgi:hypothetical protein